MIPLLIELLPSHAAGTEVRYMQHDECERPRIIPRLLKNEAGELSSY